MAWHGILLRPIADNSMLGGTIVRRHRSAAACARQRRARQGSAGVCRAARPIKFINPPCSVQQPRCNRQRAAFGMQHAARRLKRMTRTMQPTTCHQTDDGTQRATCTSRCNRHHTAHNVEPQQATCRHQNRMPVPRVRTCARNGERSSDSSSKLPSHALASASECAWAAARGLGCACWTCNRRNSCRAT
jgi:hypothetical protein